MSFRRQLWLSSPFLPCLSACLLFPPTLLAVKILKEAGEVGLTVCQPASRESQCPARRGWGAVGGILWEAGRAGEGVSPMGRY